MARYLSVRPEELLLTNGGDDALRVFFDTFVESPHRHPDLRAYLSDVPLLRGDYGARISVLRYGSEMNSRSRASSLRCVRSRVFSSSPIPIIRRVLCFKKRSCGES